MFEGMETTDQLTAVGLLRDVVASHFLRLLDCAETIDQGHLVLSNGAEELLVCAEDHGDGGLHVARSAFLLAACPRLQDDCFAVLCSHGHEVTALPVLQGSYRPITDMLNQLLFLLACKVEFDQTCVFS